MLGESKVIRRFLMAWGSMPLTSAFFEGQLYYIPNEQCRNILIKKITEGIRENDLSEWLKKMTIADIYQIWIEGRYAYI